MRAGLLHHRSVHLRTSALRVAHVVVRRDLQERRGVRHTRSTRLPRLRVAVNKVRAEELRNVIPQPLKRE